MTKMIELANVTLRGGTVVTPEPYAEIYKERIEWDEPLFINGKRGYCQQSEITTNGTDVCFIVFEDDTHAWVLYDEMPEAR